MNAPRTALWPAVASCGLFNLLVVLAAAPLRADDASSSVSAEQPASKPAAPAVSPPVAIRRIAPQHPAALRDQDGDATIECLVSETGEIRDVQVKSASSPEFGEAAAEALKQWQFKAGERNGTPVAMRISIPFTFTVPTRNGLEKFAKRSLYEEINEPVVPVLELGSLPVPKKMVQPKYPAELAGSGKRGKAVVSLVINKEGKVVNPRIAFATYPEFVAPALAAAVSLDFPPQLGPKKEKVYVSMDVQFDFKDDGHAPRVQNRPNEKQPAPEKSKKL